MNRSGKVIVGVGVALLGVISAEGVASPRHDELAKAFQYPPQSARPQVWWHWLNGNISEEGARLDLEWLSRIGVGGVQIFEGNLGTPVVVPERQTYMSPKWRQTFRSSVTTARSLGLDVAIATSPGWSATGGPWVSPSDAMKKIVWSETVVTGGKRFTGRLIAPPAVVGPYLDVPLSDVEPGASPVAKASGLVRVIAYRSSSAPFITPAAATSGQLSIPIEPLIDGRWANALPITLNHDRKAVVRYDLGSMQTIRSVHIGLPAPRGFGAPPAPFAFLDTSEDGYTFNQVAVLPPSTAPARSASFLRVKARWVQLRIEPDDRPSPMASTVPTPGVVLPPLGPPPPKSVALSEFRVSARPWIRAAEEKAGFATLPDYYAASTVPGNGVDPRDIVDISDKVGSDGSLDWTPPPGDWTILRFGWSLTGHRNGPAPVEATGLEVDKLDAGRVSQYMETYLSRYRDTLGGSFSGLTGLLSDSIESGSQNWTERLPDEFLRRRGYDPLPLLPVLTGVVVGDAERSDKFLWDWRRTISDLYADAHYATIAGAARRRGLTYYSEALEDHRPQLGDDMAIRASADIPMAAMWTLPDDGRPLPTYVADIQGAASVANLYGKPYVATESFTAFAKPWAFAPADLKTTADLEFALGVNRLVIHTSPHQPLIGSKPGMALATFLGQYFSRNETWASMADGWISYLSRSSLLLQQGHHVADVLYFYGDEAPLTALFGDRYNTEIPAGHGFDYVNSGALAATLVVQDGMIVSKSGTRYRLIQLGGSSHYLTLESLQRLSALVDAGAALAGPQPIGSPSLSDSPAAVTAAISYLWGPGGEAARRVGLGMVFPQMDAKVALDYLGVAPDWTFAGPASAILSVQHRATADHDIYFVANRAPTEIIGTFSLRVNSGSPERWNAANAARVPLTYSIDSNAMHIPLSLAAHEATFIVIDRRATARSRVVASEAPRLIARLDDGWTRQFAVGGGAPTKLSAVSLGDWSTSSDPAIRYYSGIANYQTTLRLNARDATRALLIDLGKVADVAEVYVNGRRAGVAWHAPWTVDLTGFTRSGINTIEVRVANLWVNRLIGDAQPGADKITFTTGPTYKADAPLRPSGLLGPVTIIDASVRTH